MISKVLKKTQIFWEYLKKPMSSDDFEGYDEHWKKRSGRTVSIHRAEIVSEYIEPGPTILDIGCGDSTLVDYISKNNSPKQTIGIDMSRKAIEYTKSLGCKAYEMDVPANAFKPFTKVNSFDYVVLTDVLEHI